MALYINGNKTGGGGGNSNMRELTQSEYDSLTTEEKNNGTVYYITDGDDGNGGYQLIQPIIYSEDEREVGVWIDGKPLYQKTYTNVSLQNNSDATLETNVSDFEIKDFEIDFIGVSGNVAKLRNCDDSLYVNNNGTLIYWINASSWWSGLSVANITVRYTKTTDIAGSGKWTPQGTPAVHYSTEEQVVGTWVDGSTIYEKTIVVNSTILIGQDNIINHNISNFGRCVSITGTCTYNQQNEYLPLPYFSSNTQTYGIILGNVTNTRFQITPASGFTSIENVVVTIQYTKTTT